MSRFYASINANGTRGPARVERPDQHVRCPVSQSHRGANCAHLVRAALFGLHADFGQVYEIKAKSGTLVDAPYVLMATTGFAGRFNRAQRACSNMDEGLHLFISGLLLQGAVFGPLAMVVALVYAYGALRFANDYTESLASRTHGFMLMAISGFTSFGLVAVVAVRALLVPLVLRLR